MKKPQLSVIHWIMLCAIAVVVAIAMVEVYKMHVHRQVTLAYEYAARIKLKIDANPRYKDIEVHGSADVDGCVYVTGTVPAKEDLAALHAIVEPSPVFITWRVHASAK